MTTLYINANIYTSRGFKLQDVAVCDGLISAIGHNLSGDQTIDLRGLHLLPGLVDVHVHLREPGFSTKETIASGTAAAAAGGYTTICSMPNLSPAPDTINNLTQQLEIIRGDALVRVVPYGCITRGQLGKGELADMEAMAPYVAGFSDDGRGVQGDILMAKAMNEAAEVDRPIVAHCEVDALLRGGYIHDGDYCRKSGHKGICSESEWAQVDRDIKLVEFTGCQYHLCHVSTKQSVELIRAAKARGLRVSCETAPHYLLLCDEDLQEDGRFKMNPPLRSSEDRDALIAGVLDGTIEIIATDHAPHTADQKSRGLEGSAFGVVGLECAFALLYKYMVLSGLISLEKLVELMSDNPRRIFGFGGGLAVGCPADFTVMDLEAQYTIDPSTFLSLGRSTPFEGWQTQGRTRLTVVGGEVVYDYKTMKLNR